MNLSESQRAIVAGKLANLEDGQRKSGSPIGEGATTQAEAADLLNVGKRSVERAREVLNDGSAELVHAVEQGLVSVSAAADVARVAHRPDDPRALRREAENLIALGLSIQDAAQALDLLPGAVAQLLNDHHNNSNH
jgi:hypothetical protein